MLCDSCLEYSCFFNHNSCLFYVCVYKFTACGIFFKEGCDCFGVFAYKFASCNDNAGDRFAVGVNFFPLCAKVKHYFKALYLRLCYGNVRLGKHSDTAFAFLEDRDDLRRLALEFYGNVVFGVDSVCLKNISERIFGSCVFTGSINSLALEVFNGSDICVFAEQVKHAEIIDCEKLYFTLGLVVKYRRKIGGDCGYIKLTLYEQGRYFICRAGDGKVIIALGCAV